MAFQSRGSRGLSPSVSSILTPVSAYGQALYLDRGYAFFAPDPGPSHLMAIEVSSKDEADVATTRIGRVPSLEEQWPRLLYHRHFMLAEFLNESYQPALPIEAAQLIGPDLPAEELQAWRLGRKRYEAIVNSMQSHLKKSLSSEDAGKELVVEIKRVEHMIPDFVGFKTRSIPLDAPDSYITFDDIPITLETLVGGQPEALPQPGFTEPVPVPSGEPSNSSVQTESSSGEKTPEIDTGVESPEPSDDSPEVGSGATP